MYRIDHLAFRTKEEYREKTVKFFVEAMGYRVQENFEIPFSDDKNDVALCAALEPTNRTSNNLPWNIIYPFGEIKQEYVLAPEIFVSAGGNVVKEWVDKKGPGLHHIALQVPDDSTVEREMDIWLQKGWTEKFSSKTPFSCDDMTQIFTSPSQLTGVVFELIKRKEHGFCKTYVKYLMLSSKND